MRRDRQRLTDILEALEAISRFTEGKSEEEFLLDEVLCDAVARRLAIVGEAAGRVSRELRQRHQSIPWFRIVAFRNILVHEYFGVHWPIVWQTATVEAPLLYRQITEVLRIELEPGL